MSMREIVPANPAGSIVLCMHLVVSETKGLSMNTEDIALIVDEPIDGHFYWILQQRDCGDGNPRAVDAAPGPMPTYGSALMAGIAALQRRSRPRTNADYGVPITPAYQAGRTGPTAFGPATLH
jgi:hypothetical protein